MPREFDEHPINETELRKTAAKDAIAPIVAARHRDFPALKSKDAADESLR